MNWRNPFISGYLAFTVVGAGLFGYLAYSSYSNYAAVSETYDSQVLRLQQLQNRRPFPSDANNTVLRDLSAEYRREFDHLVATISRMQQPVESITPQTFQDRLRDYVSAVNTAAKTNKVALDENFYLGFDQYRNALPSNEAAPALARELDSIRFVVDTLVNSQVREIKSIRRDPLPEETGRAAAAPTPPPRPGVPPRPGSTPAAPTGPKIVTANAFDVVFVADQGRFRQALNEVVRAPRFFVLRSLNVQNEKLEGPAQKEDAAAGTTEPAADPLAALLSSGNSAGKANVGAAPAMRLLVGRETLTVGARFEILNFTLPTAAANSR